MKKNYAITVSVATIGELKELIKDIPDDYFINCCGEREFYINVCDESTDVCIDTIIIDWCDD